MRTITAQEEVIATEAENEVIATEAEKEVIATEVEKEVIATEAETEFCRAQRGAQGKNTKKEQVTSKGQASGAAIAAKKEDESRAAVAAI